MAHVPSNPKLWRMLVAQAKQKFHVYPSPAASHWVHEQYVKHGGQFTDSEKKVDPKMKDKK